MPMIIEKLAEAHGTVEYPVTPAANTNNFYSVYVDVTTGAVEVYNHYTSKPAGPSARIRKLVAEKYPADFAAYAATAAAYNAPEAVAERQAIAAQVRATQAKIDASRAARRAARTANG